MKKYEIIRHEKMNFDQHCIAYPSQVIAEKDEIYISKSMIMYSYEETKIVFFVDGNNGDNYGQYTNQIDAQDRFNYLLNLSTNDRKKEDR